MQSVISIIGLSFSLACFALCMYVVRSMNNIDKNYPDADNMYTLVHADKGSDETQIVYQPVVGSLISRQLPEIKEYTSVNFHDALLMETEKENQRIPFILNTLEVSPSFFEFLSLDFVQSPAMNYKEQQNGVIITEETALKLFGKTQLDGEKIYMKRDYNRLGNSKRDEEISYTICGVIKEFPTLSYFNLQQESEKNSSVFLFNDIAGNLNENNRNGWWSGITVLKLHENVSVEQFNEKLKTQTFTFDAYFTNPKEKEYSLMPFNKSFEKMMGSNFNIILVFLALLGSLVLLVAVFNYVSYCINSFLNKMHETAVRKTLNAGWLQLLFFFFVEIMIIIVISGLLAIAWITLFSPFITELFGFIMKPDFDALFDHIFQYILIAVFIAFVACFLPVWKLHKTNIKDILYGGKSKNPKSIARNILLGFQLFFCILFVSISLFMYLQLNYISKITAGTLTQNEKENIWEINTSDPLLRMNTGEIANELKKNPNITELLLSGDGLASYGPSMTDLTFGEKRIDMDNMAWMSVGSNYAGFTHTKMLEGHFVEEDRYDQMVINETAKKLLGEENIIGQKIRNYNSEFTIVGVVEDVVLFNSIFEIRPTFFCHSEKDWIGFIYVKILPDKKKETLAYINDIIRKYLPETINYEIYTLDERITEMNRLENIMFKLVLIFTITSIIISLFGVYSSVLLNTERRRKEVAIRKINGAELKDILSLFLKTYLIILLTTAIPAFIIVHKGIQRWLEMYVYHIPVSIWLFVAIFITLIVLLVVTVIYQLMKTARENPAETLKMEN